MMGDIDEAGTYLRKEGGHYARLGIALPARPCRRGRTPPRAA